MEWQGIAKDARSKVLDAIPSTWCLDSKWTSQTASSVIDIPRNSGVLTKRQLDITDQSLVQLVVNLARGILTSVEVTEAFCARAAIAHQLARLRFPRQTNCLTAFFPEEAIDAAKACDAHYAATGKVIGPLHGIPLAIKDQYNVKGHPSTLGYIANYGNAAQDDAAIVKVLRDSGAVIFAKTTMPQTGMALETTSNLWGRTINPYNRELASGGSSGGDAVLVAMRGSPVSPSSDIGGSIRAPAAFNGHYSIRPSADRICKTGMATTLSGQISIKVSCGPVCHSLDDLKLFIKVINAYPSMQFAPGVVPLPWRDVETPKRKLTFALWDFDSVCMPHPPILRALKETANKLTAAGHEVVNVDLPFDCWTVALTTWKIYFQTGAVEMKAKLAEGGEDMLPSLKYHLEAFGIKPLSAAEAFGLNREMSEYKTAMSHWWSTSSSRTDSGRPFDAIIAPVHPSTSYPHNFASWWGYTTIWNILDYPSLTIPIKKFKISPETDPKDLDYRPMDNKFDKATYEMYDPELFANQPVCLQVVGRPFQDEEIVAVAEVFDGVVNPPTWRLEDYN
ncbi:amidase signature domain-containing protein [Exophiala viscosa]|uniref:amidase signature domain-containing protein n=1 Tax=Exophiala viscosa TaxID=2486360 RepID=UPI0021909830|nr:amidase signature domain-containing protein [Exophiala viscosa]